MLKIGSICKLVSNQHQTSNGIVYDELVGIIVKIVEMPSKNCEDVYLVEILDKRLLNTVSVHFHNAASSYVNPYYRYIHITGLYVIDRARKLRRVLYD